MERKVKLGVSTVGLESRRGPSLKNVSRAGRAVVRVNDSNRDNEATMPKEQWVMDENGENVGRIFYNDFLPLFFFSIYRNAFIEIFTNFLNLVENTNEALIRLQKSML